MKIRFKPEDLLKITYLSEPAVCPDGSRAAFTAAKADEAGLLTVPRVYENAGGTYMPLDDSGSSKSPAYSPDGRSLACLRSESGEYQVWIHELSFGALTQATHARHGVEDFCWAGNGRIIYTASFYPGEETRRFIETTPGEKRALLRKTDNAPQVIEEIAYKNDDWYGVWNGSVKHICETCLEDISERTLTDGVYDCFLPSFSPITGIAYYACPYSGTERFNTELFLCDADGGNHRQLSKAKSILADSPAAFTQGGNPVYLDMPPGETTGYICHLMRADMSGDKAADLLASQEAAVCTGADNIPVGRSTYGKPGPTMRTADGYIYYLSAYRGKGRLYRIPENGGASENVIMSELSIQSFCAPVNGSLLFSAASSEEPADLYEYHTTSGEIRRLTCLNKWLDEYERPQVKEVWADSADGIKVQGWVVYPAGYEEGKQYPAVLDIHGGPNCCYTDEFRHECMALSGAGMAVMYCNPRGSTGYGADFAKDSWSQGAVADIEGFMGAAAGLGLINRERVGVTGGSYGGYMTVKLIGTTGHFKAAAAQRPLVNLATSYGTGDIGFESAEGHDTSRTKMLKVLTDRARKSLIRYVDNIRIPLLILHGYKDYRCSFEQSEQLFVAMKERNPKVPVRLVMFPDENHGITRGGLPRNQVRHLREITLWFEKHLCQEARHE
jgi:dipeptidyl aminopeptidase/acylaminoacyl peptidase